MHYCAHPLRASWRSIRNKVRICRNDVAQTYNFGRSPQQSQAVAARPRFVTNLLEQHIYVILVTFLDNVVESCDTVNSTWAYEKFGRQLASVLRAVSFDQEYCWQLLENRILYYLMLKNYGIYVLLAWRTFINRLSDAVTKGFWQATFADLPRQLPTIFEDTPAKCFFYVQQSRPTFFARLFNLLVCLTNVPINCNL